MQRMNIECCLFVISLTCKMKVDSAFFLLAFFWTTNAGRDGPSVGRHTASAAAKKRIMFSNNDLFIRGLFSVTLSRSILPSMALFLFASSKMSLCVVPFEVAIACLTSLAELKRPVLNNFYFIPFPLFTFVFCG